LQEEKKWCVYCHTNKINGKKYIGVTSQSPASKRWGRNGVGYNYNKIFYDSIKKYGWDNFTHEILFKNLTEKEAKQKEVELIKYNNTMNKNKGYNLSYGGEGEIGFKISETSKEKMRFSAYRPIVQLKENGDFVRDWDGIKQASDYYNVTSNVIIKCCKKEKKTCRGFRWLYKEDYYKLSKEEIEEKINKDRIFGGCKPVIQLDIDCKFINEFNSTIEVEKKLGYHNSTISSCCNNHTKTEHGFIWIYKKDYEKLTKEDLIEISVEAKNRGIRVKIIQLDKSGEYLNIFYSAKEAGDYVGVCGSSILACCNNKTKMIKGYIWVYEKDYKNMLKNNTISDLVKYKNKANKKKIAQLDENNNILKVFNSVNEAKIYSGISRNKIVDCCNNKLENINGFKWKYV